MDMKQSTIGDIIESESKMILGAAKKYGEGLK